MTNEEELKAEEPGLFEKDVRNPLNQAKLTFDARHVRLGLLRPWPQLRQQPRPIRRTAQFDDELVNYRTLFTTLSWVF